MPGYPVLPYTWGLDGVQFNTGDGKYITHVEGWRGRTTPRMNKVDKVATDGTHLGGKYASGRVMPFRGVWDTSDQAARDAAIDVLVGMFDSDDPLQEYKVSRTEDTRARWTWCVLDDELDPEVVGGVIKFESQLFAADPRWFSVDQALWTPTTLATEPLGGVLWNGGTTTTGDGVLWNGGVTTTGEGVEWQQGNGSGGTLQVFNLGDDRAPVTVTMTATGGTGLSNPYVRLETGETLMFRGALAVGSYVTVDTGTRRVSVNGVNSPGVLSRADMFQLSPGAHTLTFGSSAIGDQGLLTGFHYHAYRGG